MLSPLVVGNITTVGAFLALVPLQAAALRHLGIFAASMLIGTILFCIFVLPHLMSTEYFFSAPIGNGVYPVATMLPRRGRGVWRPMGRAVFEGLLFKILIRYAQQGVAIQQPCFYNKLTKELLFKNLTRYAHQGLAIQQPHYDNKLYRILYFPSNPQRYLQYPRVIQDNNASIRSRLNVITTLRSSFSVKKSSYFIGSNT